MFLATMNGESVVLKARSGRSVFLPPSGRSWGLDRYQMEGFLVGPRRFSRTISGGTKETVKISWGSEGGKAGN